MGEMAVDVPMDEVIDKPEISIDRRAHAAAAGSKSEHDQ